MNSLHLNGVKQLMGFTVDTVLFLAGFLRRGIEKLEKLTEPDDVNEFVGDDIEHEGLEAEHLMTAQRAEDGMILKANEIVVVCVGAQASFRSLSFVADHLCEGTIFNLRFF